MELIKSKICISFLIISFFSFDVLTACGWFENSETTRLALFKAEINGMIPFRPFYYSAENYNTFESDPKKNDNIRNCKEWQDKLGKSVILDDIYKILYDTDPEIFQQAYEDKNLTVLFHENSFIKELSKTENIHLLEYIRFSKELEYFNFKSYGKWESWDDEKTTWYNAYEVEFKSNYSYIDEKIKENDLFLKTRYAFQKIKICFYNKEYNLVKQLYQEHFETSKTTSILLPWAMLYYAMSEDLTKNSIKANYLYSLVFDKCDSKKYVAMQWFNKQPQIIRQTLSYATNDFEKANILSMACLRNPGPALKQIKECESLGLGNNYFTTLIAREINKIEDWILTPNLTEYPPSVQFSDEWYLNMASAKEKNLKKDKTYLREFKAYLIECHKNSKDELRDFISLAIAHLCFINDELEIGKKYCSLIRPNACNDIQIQKNVELCLIKLKAENILTNSVQNEISQELKYIELIAKNNFEYYKTLYSLTRIISKEFKQKNNNAIAGLLFMHSERYKEKYEDQKNEYYEEPFYEYYYWPIAYFDRYATINDMDELIALILKNNKTHFQNYLTEQYLPNTNVYKDLEATIAFRNNDISLTEQILKTIPSDFWENNYEFANYLNEDPFFPKRLAYAQKRNFNYHFNKYEFIKKLNSLLKNVNKNKNADDYLQLGHVFYNCSYWGNSWMMTCYGKGSEEEFYYSSDYQFGSNFKQRRGYQEGNYFKCTIAKKYYEKALEFAKNDEQRAMASLMIHCCKEAEYDFYYYTNEENKKIVAYAPGKELFDFYNRYTTTAIFRKFQCPQMEHYIAKSSI
jgi:hypothetical protein